MAQEGLGGIFNDVFGVVVVYHILSKRINLLTGNINHVQLQGDHGGGGRWTSLSPSIDYVEIMRAQISAMHLHHIEGVDQQHWTLCFQTI